ncbi:MAG: ribosome maturation factor RimP [Actinomycetota bacterium]
MRSDNVSERVRVLVAPALEQAGLTLYDVDRTGGDGNTVLRVTVDRPGGVDLDAISEATEVVSGVLDAEPDAIAGRYLLEVSSPGIERPLRRPEHFRGAVGATVSVKTRPGHEGERRFEGVLEAAGDAEVTIAGRTIAYADIDSARTRFVWPQPRQPKRKAAAQR